MVNNLEENGFFVCIAEDVVELLLSPFYLHFKRRHFSSVRGQVAIQICFVFLNLLQFETKCQIILINCFMSNITTVNEI